MKFINIKKVELLPAFLLFISFFSIVFSSISGSTLKESIFLTNYDKSALPLMYLFTAIFMTFFIMFYKKLSVLKEQISVLLIINLFFTCSFVIFTFNLSGFRIPIFYILFEIYMGISVMQFWVIAGNTFNTRQAKRIFTLIITGGSFASILAGFFIQPFSNLYGVESLLYLSIFLIIISSISAIFLKQFQLENLPVVNDPIDQRKISVKNLSPYIRNIAILVALSSFISKVVDYQFKITATNFYTTEYELVSFFGNYYALTGLTTLVFQFFLSSYLLRNFGVLVVLLILPSIILFGSLSFLFFRNFISIFFTKFFDQVIKFSTNSTIKEILWLPISSFKKQKYKPLIDGSLKSFFEGFSGLVIFTFVYLNIVSMNNITLFSIIVILAVFLWIYNSFQLKDGYVESLLNSIESRQLNLDKVNIDIDDEKIVKTIDEALNSKNELKQLYAIDLLWEISLIKWKNTIRKLFLDGSIKVKRAVLELTWNNKDIIKDNLMINQIKKNNLISEHAIICAYDRDIRGLNDILSDILTNKNEELHCVSAIILLKNDINNKTALKVFNKIKNSNNSKVISSMLSNIKIHPELLKQDELINIYHNYNVDMKNIVLDVIKEKPDKIFFEIIFESILNPKLKKNALGCLMNLPRNYSKAKLSTILKNSKTNRLIIIEILKFGDKIIDLTFINQLISFLNHNDSQILNEASNAIISISKKENLGKDIFNHIDDKIEKISKRALVLYFLKINLANQKNTSLLIHEIEYEIEFFIIALIKLGTIKNPDIPLEKYIRYVKTKNKIFLPAILELIDTTFSNKSKSALLPLIDPDLNLESENKNNHNINKINEDATFTNWVENNIQWKKVVTLDYLLRNERTEILKKINWEKVDSKFLIYNYLQPNQNIYLVSNFFKNTTKVNEDIIMYSIVEKTLILKSIDLFNDIPGDLLSKIGQIAEEVQKPEGFHLFHDGDNGSSMYVIAKGRINILKDGKNITTLKTGMSIGEMALLDQEPRSADAICVEECVLLKINQFAFYELMASSNEIMKQIVKILSKRIRIMNKKLTANLK